MGRAVVSVTFVALLIALAGNCVQLIAIAWLLDQRRQR